MVFVVRKWNQHAKFKSCARLFEFHYTLMFLGKTCFPNQWINRRPDKTKELSLANYLRQLV